VSTDPETPFPDARVYTFGLDPRDAGNPDVGATVVVKERGCELHLLFDGRAGDAPLLELRVVSDTGWALEPSKARRLVPQLDLYLALARAGMSWEFGDARAAADALRLIGRPGRGLTDDFFRLIAATYDAMVAEGERYPVKAIAEAYHGSQSAASRWVTETRRRGYLPPKEAKDDAS
jgi:hypothetical protein